MGGQADADASRTPTTGEGPTVFESDATNTIKGGANGVEHVYRRGPAASSIRLVSRDNNGQQGNDDSRVAAVSADGSWVAFHSKATNLTKGTDKNGSALDVFRVGPF